MVLACHLRRSILRLWDIEFKNPIFLASGTFGYGYEFPEVTREMGAIFTKGLTRSPRCGNEPPRIFEAPCGIINRVGLENVGVEKFIADILPRIRDLTRIFVNIAGSEVEDYVNLAQRLNGNVDGIEVNVSCPNVTRGLVFGQDPDLLYELVREVKAVSRIPVVVKLTPNFCDISLTAKKAVSAGADGISLINTLNAGFYHNKKFYTGGLSGPAIKPLALYCVDRVRKVVDVPIIGIGGITSGQDVIDFLDAGADAVAIGSINLKDPKAGKRILAEYNRLEGARRD